jgi:hypothetical protein
MGPLGAEEGNSEASAPMKNMDRVDPPAEIWREDISHRRHADLKVDGSAWIVSWRG